MIEEVKKIAIIMIVLIAGIAFSMLFLSRDKIDHATIAEPYEKLDVTVKNARVVILPTSSEVTDIELTDKEKDHTLYTKMRGDTLEVEIKGKRLFQWFQFNLFSGFSQPTLTIYLPEKEYEAVQVESDNAKIEVEEVIADKVVMETDNGEINLIDVIGSTVTAEADNGKINLEHVKGKVIGKTDNGKISLITETLDQDIDLKTDNGIIEVWTENEPTNNTFDIKTDNGPISVFGSSQYDTVVGDGEYVIKLKTDNGKVTVDKR